MRERTALLSLATAALLAGCPTSMMGTPCTSDDACGVGRYCDDVAQRCTLECRRDADCLAPATCDVRGRCTGALDGGVPRDGSPACGSAAECDDGVFCNGRETCDGGSCRPATTPCTPTQTCNEDADACETECDLDADGNGRMDADNDGDGHETLDCGGDDCDDGDADRYPRGGAETCDPSAPDHDEDCNPCTIATFIRGADGDRDGEGYIDSACSNPMLPGDDAATFGCPVAIASAVVIDRDGRTVHGSDCDDSLETGMSVYGGAPEVCNGVDDDCDGTSDEGSRVPLYVDGDGDGFGESGTAPITLCADTPGYAMLATDCDDHSNTVYPGAAEPCDRRDSDCSTGGGVDLGEDRDGDGHALSSAACSGGYPKDDCNDTNAAVYVSVTGFPDADNDGYCTSGTATTYCGTLPAGVRATCSGSSDCAPSDATRWQSVTGFPDADNDSYCESSTMRTVCVGSGYSGVRGTCTRFSDCNPSLLSQHTTTRCSRDLDGDTWARAGTEGDICTDGTCPSGYTSSVAIDCNDLNVYVWSGPDCVERLGDVTDSEGHCCCIGCGEPDPEVRTFSGTCDLGYHIGSCEVIHLGGGGSATGYIVSGGPFDRNYTCGLRLSCSGCNGKTAAIRPHCVPDFS